MSDHIYEGENHAKYFHKNYEDDDDDDDDDDEEEEEDGGDYSAESKYPHTICPHQHS